MRYGIFCGALGALLVTGAAVAGAQQTTPQRSGTRPMRHDTQAQMQAEANITKDSAQRVALARVPGGDVREGELEREHGRLIWSFDIKQPGKSGIEEVQVSALDGRVVSHTHETAAHEAQETAADRRAQRRRSDRREDRRETRRDSVRDSTGH